MRISDWSSDVCSSDLTLAALAKAASTSPSLRAGRPGFFASSRYSAMMASLLRVSAAELSHSICRASRPCLAAQKFLPTTATPFEIRSEEHTSELQSLMRNSYAVFCLKQNTLNTE